MHFFNFPGQVLEKSQILPPKNPKMTNFNQNFEKQQKNPLKNDSLIEILIQRNLALKAVFFAAKT